METKIFGAIQKTGKFPNIRSAAAIMQNTYETIMFGITLASSPNEAKETTSEAKKAKPPIKNTITKENALSSMLQNPRASEQYLA